MLDATEYNLVKAAGTTQTTADSYHVHRRFWACSPLTFKQLLTETEYVPPPPRGDPYPEPYYMNRWVAGTVIYPDAYQQHWYYLNQQGWTEVTDLIEREYSMTKEWNGSAYTWVANVQGRDYSEAYFNVGQPLMSAYRIWMPETGWSSWILDWVGHISPGDYATDYKRGNKWSREVRGIDALLRRRDAPRISSTDSNLAIGSSVTVSDTITQPTLEAGNGEFIGTTVNVSAQNIVDDDLNTLWISESVPGGTDEGDPNFAQITEVFFRPVAGYAAKDSWWIEIRAGNWLYSSMSLGTIRWNGVSWQNQVFYLGKFENIGEGYGIVCANRSIFESLCSDRDVEWIKVADEISPGFTISPEYGLIYTRSITTDTCYSAVGWCEGSDAGMPAAGWGSVAIGNEGMTWGTTTWSGSLIDSSASIVKPGYSIRRTPVSNATDNGVVWAPEDIPIAGTSVVPGACSWASIELPTRSDSVLDVSASAGETSIILVGSSGWPDPSQDLGTHYAIIEGYDIFSYTNIDFSTNVMSGIPSSGPYAITDTHTSDSTVNPYVDNVEQVGWPVSKITVRRRGGVSTISSARVLTSIYAAGAIDTPDTAGYESDYQYISSQSNPSGQSDMTWILTSGTTIPRSYRWVKTFLVEILAMSDGGRAKINEVEVTPCMSVIDPIGGTLGTIFSPSSMIRYLLDLFGLPDILFTDYTSWGTGWGPNLFETAIAPYTDVLEDIARSTASIIGYGYNGDVYFLHSPLLDGGNSAVWYKPKWVFDETTIRGTLVGTLGEVEVDGIKLSGRSPSKEPWEVSCGEVSTGYQVMEEGEFVIDYTVAKRLAQVMLFEEQHQDGITITPKGIPKWPEPGQLVQLNWDFDGDGTVTTGNFLIRAVREQESGGGDDEYSEFTHRIDLDLIPSPIGQLPDEGSDIIPVDPPVFPPIY